MRKRVYCSGPLSRGDLFENVRRFDAAFFELARAGFAPLNPGLSVFAGSARARGGVVFAEAAAFAGGLAHADWIAIDLPWVAAADAVLRLPGESAGADAEVAAAREAGVPVFESVESLLDWATAPGGAP